jgi:hypothetical protein
MPVAGRASIRCQFCTARVEMFYSHAIGDSMRSRAARGLLLLPATRRWSRSRARSICPRQHLRVLPMRTRPSLFASD